MFINVKKAKLCQSLYAANEMGCDACRHASMHVLCCRAKSSRASFLTRIYRWWIVQFVAWSMLIWAGVLMIFASQVLHYLTLVIASFLPCEHTLIFPLEQSSSTKFMNMLACLFALIHWPSNENTRMHQSNEEVIRSTVSITFVNNIDEMVFTACVKQVIIVYLSTGLMNAECVILTTRAHIRML